MSWLLILAWFFVIAEIISMISILFGGYVNLVSLQDFPGWKKLTFRQKLRGKLGFRISD